MTRLIEVRGESAEALVEYSRISGRPIEEVLDEAIQRFVRESKRRQTLERAFGAWKGMEEDGLEFQRRLRSEWPD